ncbi:MAG: hypothetical protein ACLR40_01570 [Oscillospiraceae bacterium]
MEERITRGKAIRLKCLDCCCGSAMEVRLCECRKCPLWRFRMGRESTEDARDFDTENVGEVPAHPGGQAR